MPPPGKGPAWSWFKQYQQHKDAHKEKKEFIPNHCSLCGAGIETDDVYWIGVDRHDISATTCDKHHCKKWLKYKGKRRKE